METIDMQETLRLLLSLQELDEDLYRVKEELRRLPEERARRRATIESDLHRKAEELARVRELGTRLKEIDDLTTTQRQRIRKLENEASGSRADTALIVAYQHEIRGLKRTISEAEDEGLGLVEEMDAAKGRVAEIDARIDEAEKEFAEYAENVDRETAQAEARRADLEAERSRRMGDGTVPSDVLGTYERLLDAREGQALAALENRTCQGCYVGVPTNIYVRLARGQEIVTCPSCLRILYLPELLDD